MDCVQNAQPRPDCPLNESFGLLQIHIQDFASAVLENLNCKVGVTTSLLTLSQAFDHYVHFNKRYSSKSLKDTKIQLKWLRGF